MSQPIRGRVAILFFSIENVKSLRTTDDGRTDGRRTVRYDNSSLEPSAQVS